ncbi:UvrD-helicase domain-containing protein [Pseudodesulfovibrio sp.]|uniref:UvrD-helicase domain-containing protein n=1 Tax=Pseudodesulfovibrio sp. TaxID=2035812 RepID=UPI0026103C71|nr:UvrD-helicase domain-containing protein [Pseudodesulfovibrio sp.]MDD3313687.1 UvrD-helicase domain-containing protein [Pseudodesulfovibrio sp.]
MSELRQVKASAGSGKTYQLTRRFLALLDGADPRGLPAACSTGPRTGYTWHELMAVTFTNKAASEMKERVVAALKRSALELRPEGEEPPCPAATARRVLGSILRSYHRLNIRTIDSLLALLLRLFALEFGIRPDFQMAFDESAPFDAVYDQFIGRAETDGPERDLLAAAVETLVTAEGRAGFWLQSTVRDRLLELVRFLRDERGGLETDQAALRGLLAANLAGVQRSAGRLLGLLTDAGLPMVQAFGNFLNNFESADLFHPAKDSAYARKDALADCIKAAGKKDVTPVMDAAYASFKETYAAYVRDQALLMGAHNLAPTVNIALSLLKAIHDLQPKQGVVLGADLAGFVDRLLSSDEAVSEAYCRLGCRLHHLLVDEFQDTSRAQWRAITPLAGECLAKGGSLYYVGDVKQAIYGWRGGDQDLFDAVLDQDGLAELAAVRTADTLPDNWRSFKNVVAFNNDFFGRLEDPDDAGELADVLFKGAPDGFREDFARELNRNFRACAQSLPDKHAGTEGYVRMTRLEGGDKEAVEAQTLEALSGLMDELTARRPFRDIAVLVRSKVHAELACDLLVEKNIPVITENSLRLDRHPIVRQLAAFLAFLDFPRDDLSFLTFITGREVFLAESGLDPGAVNNWLATPRKRPLGVCFRDDFPDAWRRLIEPFYNQSGLMTPYDLTQETLRACRVLERHPDAELYVRRFLEVVHLAEENGYGSLSAFLEYWENQSGEEKVPLPENIDAVRIMTIHKSKGLEFPVVVVPFHNWQVRPDKDYAVRTMDGRRLLTRMRKDLGRPYFASLGRAVREQLNLLYVAWTRAREELYGFSSAPSADRPALTAMDRFLDLDGGVFEQGSLPAPGRTSTADAAPEPRDLPPATEPAPLMSWLPRLRVYRHNLDEYFYNERMRGEVAHRTMEHLRVTGDDAADADRAVRLALYDFPALGALTEAERDRLDADLRAMVAWSLSLPDLRRWLAEGERETEVMDRDGNFKRFDLLHRGETTVVADFKTGRPSPKNAEQVRDYLRILAELPGGDGPRAGWLIYLDRREIVPVEEA